MFKDIKKSSLSLILVSSLAFFAGCSDIDNTGENTVGNNLVSAEVIDDINASVMLSVVQATIKPDANNAFGYKAVKINYNTVDEMGEDVEASGLLVIPTATPEYQAYRAAMGMQPFSVSMICDNHGTAFLDAEVPSNVEVSNYMPDYPQAVLMTGLAGFAAVLPDYVGYGTSIDSNHPYMLKEASARASLDMIRASVRYMTDTNVVFNTQLYVSGYSQGGFNAMALTQDIEENHNDEFTLMAMAPMAGPYDLVAFGDRTIDASHVMRIPAFLGYVADSYSIAYDDLNLTDLVNETNTTMYHSLFDGTKSSAVIQMSLGLTDNYGYMSYTSDALMKISLIDDYQNDLNTGLALKNRYAENSTYDWAPKTKVNLIHCVDDEVIPFSMSQTAYDTFTANGSENITLSPIPSSMIPPATELDPFVHTRCASTAYGASVEWFAAIRNGDI